MWERMLNESSFFFVFISITFYEICAYIQKKPKFSFFNPLLMTLVFIVLTLAITGTSSEEYAEKTEFLSYLLTPATVCLAIPLYEKLGELKKNAAAILVGILSGVFTSALTVLAVAYFFSLDSAVTASFVPKSVTTAIGIGICEELGGITSLTAISIILTGIVGNAVSETVCRIFRITEPVAIGAAIGTSSHVGGTAKALQMGKTEGAISGLSIAVAGIMTVIVAPVIMNFI